MHRTVEGTLIAGELRFAVVVSRFNHFISDRLVEGALDAIVRHGGASERVTLLRVPGAFELPLAARKAAQSGQFDAVVCLGALIRGATPHFEYIAAESIKGIAQAAMDSGVPISYGVITADTLDQAIERAGTKAGNKGSDAALAAIEMANLYRALAG